MARQIKLFLAEQIRALRGNLTQKEFGEHINKPQSVVSRLEKQADRHISIQTLIDIAERLDLAVLVRFVDFPTFLKYTEDYSDSALAPASYCQADIDALAQAEERRARDGELRGLFIDPTETLQSGGKKDDTTRTDTSGDWKDRGGIAVMYDAA
jgi:transcriptional regulator with XRE-family HTH domain